MTGRMQQIGQESNDRRLFFLGESLFCDVLIFTYCCFDLYLLLF
ncbi:hypothetical protein CLOSTHATH_01469 [Hungatella hathewayi DSM 13479]|uniref:Uncharacterized protein n=1 Tax=Hungatella hathewayi DSM 13479 TaxID=566550 RepID=D3ACZ1_9FIRM|nr:hypothetical protein CLOSTHATH_01469 [Hungatella hathewayi DSM 13479]